MNFFIVLSVITFGISGKLIHRNPHFLKATNFEKRHALTAEQVLANANIALNILRITLALIFGTPVPKVSKPHLGSISSSN